MAEVTGRQIDHYRIDALLGQGGMGAVYRAHDLNLDRPVALKVMHRRLTEQPRFRQLFMEEAQAAARLNHPSIVSVYRFDESRGLLYLVMELIEGPTLSAELRRMEQSGNRVNLYETLVILAQVADALSYAHRQGVIHRDVKPGNIMLRPLDAPEREGDPPVRAVVTDFGLAHLLPPGGATVAAEKMIGTLAYMSPEQCLEQPMDGRSDLYSLGIVLYRMATGRLPFDITTPAGAVQKHAHENPAPPRSLQPDLPAAVEAIILRAMAKAPDQRFQTAEEMAQALRQTAGQLTDEATTQLPAADDRASTAAPQTMAPSTMQPLPPLTSFTEPSTQLPVSEQSNGRSNGVTRLQPPFVAPVPRTEAFRVTSPISGDRLIIAREGEASRAEPMDKPTITIGREEGNDVILSDPMVSRRHLRLERTASGWQAVDLHSSNPAELEGSPLLPDYPETWDSGQTLRVGPYFLRWQRAGAALPAAEERHTTRLPEASFPAGQPGTEGPINIRLTPANVNVNPGERARVQVELLNVGFIVDHFELGVEGLPSSWVTIPQNEVQLMPGAQSSLPFTIHPPADSSATAGEHPFQIVATAVTDPTQWAAADGLVIVAPFEQLSLEIQPTRLRHKGACRAEIRNDGNVPVHCTIGGRDPAEALSFDTRQTSLTMPPGSIQMLPITIRARKRPWLGRARTFDFSIILKTAAGQELSESGQVDVRPVFPRWLPPVLLLAIPLVVAGLFFYRRTANEHQAATATVMAVTSTAEASALFAQQTQLATNATAQATANLATSVAATSMAATVVALGDDDEDGLANFQELNKGTDPGNPDTDGDGLLDGQEVNQYGTDPLNRDTDGDTLDDYTELFICNTVPTNPDTDNDGVIDGLDSNPLLWPTETPTQTPTPTITPTSTPTSTFTPTSTPTPTPLPITVTLPLIKSESGLITASGTVTTTSAESAPMLEFGIDGGGQPVRSFFGFSLTDLPGGKRRLISARLVLPPTEITGDPFASLGNLILDKLDYGSGLDGGDFFIIEDEVLVADLLLVEGKINLTEVVRPMLGEVSRLQLRLRFEGSIGAPGNLVRFTEHPTLVLTFSGRN